MTTMRQLATFQIETLRLGVPVGRVREILHPQPLTPVPLSDPTLAGLINVRGSIVAALDLRRRLGLPERAASIPLTNLVVSHGHEVTSLLIDAALEVLTVDDAQFEPPPETLRGESRELITGAYKLHASLLLLLDIDKAIRRPS
jgi:purine-binding chemotaxis protein CheW